MIVSLIMTRLKMEENLTGQDKLNTLRLICAYDDEMYYNYNKKLIKYNKQKIEQLTNMLKEAEDDIKEAEQYLKNKTSEKIKKNVLIAERNAFNSDNFINIYDIREKVKKENKIYNYVKGTPYIKDANRSWWLKKEVCPEPPSVSS